MTEPNGMAAAPVAIVGAGSWGTALAIHLGRRGDPVRLWGRDPVSVERIRSAGENPWYLPGIPIPRSVLVTSAPAEALSEAELVIAAVPSHFLGGVLESVARAIPSGAALVSATKGLEPNRSRRMSDVLAEAAPGRPVAVLSGPSFARDVALGRPTALVIACRDEPVGRSLQQRLGSRELRLYTNSDVVGVEIGGALKNVIAIATGLSEGLGLGENARAALITRGLAEITRLGVALGASPGTFAGLAGVGDLVLTCTGSLSRNRALGLGIGQGKSLAEVEGGSRMIAEGVRTVSSALRLAGAAGVSMPICEQVSAVLFGHKPVSDALESLLAREPRPENEGLAASRAGRSDA